MIPDGSRVESPEMARKTAQATLVAHVTALLAKSDLATFAASLDTYFPEPACEWAAPQPRALKKTLSCASEASADLDLDYVDEVDARTVQSWWLDEARCSEILALKSVLHFRRVSAASLKTALSFLDTNVASEIVQAAPDPVSVVPVVVHLVSLLAKLSCKVRARHGR